MLFRVVGATIRKHVPTICDGSATSLRIWVSHPLCLRLELDEQCAHPLLVWDFPASIKLIGLDSSDNEVECYYDIVGRAFFSPSSNHFTCSIADFDGQCYEYDDTAHCGMLTLVGDIAPFAAVAGKDNPTSRQARQTVAVVYHLRGGIEDQDKLLRKSRADLSHFLQISMTKPTNELPPYVISSDPNLKILGDSEVLWIKDLASSTAIDYDYDALFGANSQSVVADGSNMCVELVLLLPSESLLNS